MDDDIVTVVAPCKPTPAMLTAGAKALDLWSDDTLAETIDGYQMAELVWNAMTSV